MENLVLGGALSLGYSCEPALHIQHALVGAVSSGCSLVSLLNSRTLSGKISGSPLYQPCLSVAKGDAGRWLSEQMSTAGMSMERDAQSSPIPFLRCVTWLALGLPPRVFLQSCLDSW